MKKPIKQREVCRHLKQKWRRLQHALDLRNDPNLQVNTNAITARMTQKEKTQQIILAHNNFQLPHGLVQFRYITKPKCITNQNGQTLIHLEQLNDNNAVTQATNAVNHYYFHTLKHPSHRSKEFWENFIEHFGAYTLYNVLLYTSSNIASSHN